MPRSALVYLPAGRLRLPVGTKIRNCGRTAFSPVISQMNLPEGDSVVTIVGKGRIGSALADMSPYPTTVVGRGDSISTTENGPIIICTRNDDLSAIVDLTPPSRKPDLVFVQNGMLLPWLTENGLEDNTQALIYFGVSTLGAKPMDGVTELDPEGLTTVYGKHASTLSTIIKAGGLGCKVNTVLAQYRYIWERQVSEKGEFLTAMLEKLIWISAVMLVGTEHGVNVGEVDNDHSEEVSALMGELAEAGCQELGISVTDNMVARLSAYSKATASYPCAIKEFKWRNGWFYNLSLARISEGKPDPCKMHTDLLKKVGAV